MESTVETTTLWDLIRTWCQRHSGKHAILSLGENVTFDVLKEVTQILDTQDQPFGFIKSEPASDPECRWNIKLEIFSKQE